MRRQYSKKISLDFTVSLILFGFNVFLNKCYYRKLFHFSKDRNFKLKNVKKPFECAGKFVKIILNLLRERRCENKIYLNYSVIYSIGFNIIFRKC